MMRAETPAQFATVLRWAHVPAWVFILSLVGFIRLHLRAGRPWLGWTICALRTLALLLNFLVGQNLNYREVTAPAAHPVPRRICLQSPRGCRIRACLSAS